MKRQISPINRLAFLLVLLLSSTVIKAQSLEATLGWSNRTELSSAVSGTITRVDVKAGQHVKKDTILTQHIDLVPNSSNLRQIPIHEVKPFQLCLSWIRNIINNDSNLLVTLDSNKRNRSIRSVVREPIRNDNQLVVIQQKLHP